MVIFSIVTYKIGRSKNSYPFPRKTKLFFFLLGRDYDRKTRIGQKSRFGLGCIDNINSYIYSSIFSLDTQNGWSKRKRAISEKYHLQLGQDRDQKWQFERKAQYGRRCHSAPKPELDSAGHRTNTSTSIRWRRPKNETVSFAHESV